MSVQRATVERVSDEGVDLLVDGETGPVRLQVPLKVSDARTLVVGDRVVSFPNDAMELVSGLFDSPMKLQLYDRIVRENDLTAEEMQRVEELLRQEAESRSAVGKYYRTLGVRERTRLESQETPRSPGRDGPRELP